MWWTKSKATPITDTLRETARMLGMRAANSDECGFLEQVLIMKEIARRIVELEQRHGTPH